MCVMKVNIIPIGNSRGIRIPKAFIKECGLGDQVEVNVRDGNLVVAPAHVTRSGWEVEFERMAAAGDDRPLVPEDLVHEWDDSEWEW